MLKDEVEGFDQARGAFFDGEYRYLLWRRWNPIGKTLMIIGLNPSYADGIQDDPTIGKCIAAATRWGFGQIIMTNLFAFKATNPAEMMASDRPVGPMNDKWLIASSKESDVILAGWGDNGSWLNRDEEILKMLDADMMCTRLTKLKQPWHPRWLRLEDRLTPFVMSGNRLG